MNPNVEIFLSVGGDGSSNSYGGASSDTKFAGNVQEFIQGLGCNGYDIDWETTIDINQLNSLAANLSSVLHANNCKLSLDGFSYPNPNIYDLKTLSQYLDQINIMSYGAGDNIDDDVSAYVHYGFPINKLVGGIETEFTYSGGVDTLGLDGSINFKAQYALKNGMAGMMSWRLDNDYCTQYANIPTYQGGMQLWSSMNSPINTSWKSTCVLI